jgi:hypothetical protein
MHADLVFCGWIVYKRSLCAQCIQQVLRVVLLWHPKQQMLNCFAAQYACSTAKLALNRANLVLCQASCLLNSMHYIWCDLLVKEGCAPRLFYHATGCPD